MIPGWISKLRVQERARTRILPSRLDSATCSADLKVVFAEIPYRDEKRIVCVNYERARGVNHILSEEHCPNCPYNTDNLRKEADIALEKAIAPLLRETSLKR